MALGLAWGVWASSSSPACSSSPGSVSSLSVSERTAISVEDVSVTYRTSLEKAPTLRSTVTRLGRREKIVREIEAVRNVSFDVPHGEVLGIVGANGAGKSTLVRTIAGILPPSEGRVEIHGRVSTLLALGVGFNKKLSGRDNVVLGGLAAGLKRGQLAEKYDDIVAFAELEDFMDMPMRTYSSGMYGRLAFSVAVMMEPDILLIDEALSVGDAKFRRKCARKMRELCSEDRTVVLVSHALGTIQELADHAIWMDKGQMRMWDDPDTVVNAYTEFLGCLSVTTDPSHVDRRCSTARPGVPRARRREPPRDGRPPVARRGLCERARRTAGDVVAVRAAAPRRAAAQRGRALGEGRSRPDVPARARPDAHARAVDRRARAIWEKHFDLLSDVLDDAFPTEQGDRR